MGHGQLIDIKTRSIPSSIMARELAPPLRSPATGGRLTGLQGFPFEIASLGRVSLYCSPALKRVEGGMWVRTVALVVIGLLLAAPNVEAAWETGSDLLRQCSHPLGSRLEALCLGYVTGIAGLGTTPLITESRSFCIPETKTRTELRDAVVEYLRRNPDKLRHPAAHSVFDAYVLAFPCPK